MYEKIEGQAVDDSAVTVVFRFAGTAGYVKLTEDDITRRVEQIASECGFDVEIHYEDMLGSAS